MVLQSASSSLINGSDEMLESMFLSCVSQIYDGASKFHRIIMYTQIVVKCSRFDLLHIPTMLPHVALWSENMQFIHKII